jgi:hypothetical protein
MPSILLAECRPGTTTAALIEAVEGWPRFVASGRASTDGNPIAAIQRACEVITGRTGRRLFGEKGDLLIPQQPTGQGVDGFVAAMDAAPPPPGLFTSAEDYHHGESLRGTPGVDQLRDWSDARLRPVPFCLATMIRYLGEIHEANVIGIDLGMTESWLVAWHLGRLTVIAGGGLEVSTEAYPHSDGRELTRALIASLWRGWATTGGSHALQQPPALNLILLRGSALAAALAPLDIARVVVDVVQPGGTCTLLWDRDGLIAPLGALAASNPAISACLLDGDALIRLGTLIAPWGRPPSKGAALRFTLNELEGRIQRGDVATGGLQQIPLPLGRSAMLTVHPASRLDLGAGRPGRAARVEVPGGLIGLLLDGRGRPLPTPD